MKDYLLYTGVAACLGALTGFGLSFTAFSPLVIAGVVGCIFPALIAVTMVVCAVGLMLYYFYKRKHSNNTEFCPQLFELIGAAFGFTFLSAYTGTVAVGLAAAGQVLFPGVMLLEMWSSVLVGAILAPVSFFTAILVAEGICAKINSNVIEPTVEKIKEYFSSRQEEMYCD